MKLFTSSLCALAALTFASTARAQSTFSDVPDTHWAAPAVKRLAELGIIEGFPPSAPAPVRQATTPKSKIAAKSTKTFNRKPRVTVKSRRSSPAPRLK